MHLMRAAAVLLQAIFIAYKIIRPFNIIRKLFLLRHCRFSANINCVDFWVTNPPTFIFNRRLLHPNNNTKYASFYKKKKINCKKINGNHVYGTQAWYNLYNQTSLFSIINKQHTYVVQYMRRWFC